MKLLPKCTIAAASLGCLAMAAVPQAARATESGASLYLLGSGGPGTAVMAPVEGVYFDKLIWVYDGKASAGRSIPVNGNITAGLDTTIVADFATLLLVPTTKALGGTLALGITMPYGAPMVSVEALLSSASGASLSGFKRDSALTTGDPVGLGMLGWKAGNLHIQASTMVNFPVGNYRDGALANLSLHRWAVDGSLALSLHNPASGWDLTAKAGHTWNGRNDTSGYDSGNEVHVEGSIEKTFSPHFSLGVQSYYQKQVTDDHGSLGAFRGEVVAVGATAATTVIMARVPATFRGRVFRELDVTNRLKGTSFWLDFSVPIHMNLPAG